MKGISTNPEKVTVWIQCFSICSHLSKSYQDEIYDDAKELEKIMKPNRHKEEGMRVLWENSHPLTTETATLYYTLLNHKWPGGGWKGECVRCIQDWAGHEHTFLFIASWGISCTHLK